MTTEAQLIESIDLPKKTHTQRATATAEASQTDTKPTTQPQPEPTKPKQTEPIQSNPSSTDTNQRQSAARIDTPPESDQKHARNTKDDYDRESMLKAVKASSKARTEKRLTKESETLDRLLRGLVWTEPPDAQTPEECKPPPYHFTDADRLQLKDGFDPRKPLSNALWESYLTKVADGIAPSQAYRDSCGKSVARQTCHSQASKIGRQPKNKARLAFLRAQRTEVGEGQVVKLKTRADMIAYFERLAATTGRDEIRIRAGIEISKLRGFTDNAGEGGKADPAAVFKHLIRCKTGGVEAGPAMVDEYGPDAVIDLLRELTGLDLIQRGDRAKTA